MNLVKNKTKKRCKDQFNMVQNGQLFELGAHRVQIERIKTGLKESVTMAGLKNAVTEKLY